MLEYLDYNEYCRNARNSARWKSYAQRWAYHARAIEVIRKSCAPDEPRRVLEVGAFGAALIRGSVVMDFAERMWQMPDYHPEVTHDARVVQWPFNAGRFDLLIALRVWHHLHPYQSEAFCEAKRVARKILIVCPEQETIGVGVTREQFVAFNGGVAPLIEEEISGWGILYLFAGGVHG